MSTGIASRTAILTGPTATGKTAVALSFAAGKGIEIINADSMLVYTGMNIGTAKPTAEEMNRVRHHLIDIRDPDQPFTAGDFVREVEAALDDVHRRGNRALIVGGTGFYLKALLYGMWEAAPSNPELRRTLDGETTDALHAELLRLDPASATRIGPKDRYRLIRALEIIRTTRKTPTELEQAQPKKQNPSFELLIIDRAGDELEIRIKLRTRQMIENGLLDETRRLHERYPSARALGAVGYRETLAFLESRAPEGRKVRPGLPGLEDEIRLATRQLVKRQRTWFRGQTKAAQGFTLERDLPALNSALASVYE